MWSLVERDTLLGHVLKVPIFPFPVLFHSASFLPWCEQKPLKTWAEINPPLFQLGIPSVWYNNAQSNGTVPISSSLGRWRTGSMPNLVSGWGWVLAIRYSLVAWLIQNESYSFVMEWVWSGLAVSGQSFSLRQKPSDTRILICSPSFFGRLDVTHKAISKHFTGQHLLWVCCMPEVLGSWRHCSEWAPSPEEQR